eukprot:CAMPEP_0184647918 /NCGR_PEP_ID=MMETSP0308-20130426/4955_1 /TAXON_ID=38269 /ORGANISM="Gloeochaete witrockiana, Strain SAG 46.84" /LENGTH=1549 /DNA_ID=CAMNT_0027079331 /DNA_START=314 /DNA_END=4963 /DNA_ORIENTATION=-
MPGSSAKKVYALKDVLVMELSKQGIPRRTTIGVQIAGKKKYFFWGYSISDDVAKDIITRWKNHRRDQQRGHAAKASDGSSEETDRDIESMEDGLSDWNSDADGDERSSKSSKKWHDGASRASSVSRFGDEEDDYDTDAYGQDEATDDDANTRANHSSDSEREREGDVQKGSFSNTKHSDPRMANVREEEEDDEGDEEEQVKRKRDLVNDSRKTSSDLISTSVATLSVDVLDNNDNTDANHVGRTSSRRSRSPIAPHSSLFIPSAPAEGTSNMHSRSTTPRNNVRDSKSPERSQTFTSPSQPDASLRALPKSKSAAAKASPLSSVPAQEQQRSEESYERILEDTEEHTEVQAQRQRNPARADSSSDSDDEQAQVEMETVRKGTLLSVHLVEAKDLAARDTNGYSDPYCIIKCDGQKFKSHIIWKSLSPTWDEIFTVRVDDPQSVLCVTIMDKDLVGSDDYMGEVTVPLSRLSLETTFDEWLKVVSKSSGDAEAVSGRLHLRIFPANAKEGGKAMQASGDNGNNNLTPVLKDIKSTLSHVQQSFRHVKDRALDMASSAASPVLHAASSAANIATRMVSKTSSSGTLDEDVADEGQVSGGDIIDITLCKGRELGKDLEEGEMYCEVTCGSTKEVSRDVPRKSNPTWNQHFSIRVENVHEMLLVTLFDRTRTGRGIYKGEVQIPLYEVQLNVPHRRWYQLVSSKNDGNSMGGGGALSLELSASRGKNADKDQDADDDSNNSSPASILKSGEGNMDPHATKSEHLRWRGVGSGFPLEEGDRIIITIVEGRRLVPRDLDHFADPYCILQCGSHSAQTASIKRAINPVWNETFSFSVDKTSDAIRVVVLDKGKVGGGRDDYMGEVSYSLSDLKAEKHPTEQLVNITSRRPNATVSGSLRIRVSAEKSSAVHASWRLLHPLDTAAQQALVQHIVSSAPAEPFHHGISVTAALLLRAFQLWVTLPGFPHGPLLTLLLAAISDIAAAGDMQSVALWLSIVSAVALWLSVASSPHSPGQEQGYPLDSASHAFTSAASQLYAAFAKHLHQSLSNVVIPAILEAPFQSLGSSSARSSRFDGQEGASTTTATAALKSILDDAMQTCTRNCLQMPIIRQLFLQAFTYMDVKALDSMLCNDGMCTTSSAVAIKLGLSDLDVWAATNASSLGCDHNAELRLHRVREACDVLMLESKDVFVSEEERNNVCPHLNDDQIRNILLMLSPDEFTRSPAPASVLESVSGRQRSVSLSSASFRIDPLDITRLSAPTLSPQDVPLSSALTLIPALDSYPPLAILLSPSPSPLPPIQAPSPSPSSSSSHHSKPNSPAGAALTRSMSIPSPTSTFRKEGIKRSSTLNVAASSSSSSSSPTLRLGAGAGAAAQPAHADLSRSASLDGGGGGGGAAASSSKRGGRRSYPPADVEERGNRKLVSLRESDDDDGNGNGNGSGSRGTEPPPRATSRSSQQEECEDEDATSSRRGRRKAPPPVKGDVDEQVGVASRSSSTRTNTNSNNREDDGSSSRRSKGSLRQTGHGASSRQVQRQVDDQVESDEDMTASRRGRRKPTQ